MPSLEGISYQGILSLPETDRNRILCALLCQKKDGSGGGVLKSFPLDADAAAAAFGAKTGNSFSVMLGAVLKKAREASAGLEGASPTVAASTVKKNGAKRKGGAGAGNGAVGGEKEKPETPSKKRKRSKVAVKEEYDVKVKQEEDAGGDGDGEGRGDGTDAADHEGEGYGYLDGVTPEEEEAFEKACEKACGVELWR